MAMEGIIIQITLSGTLSAFKIQPFKKSVLLIDSLYLVSVENFYTKDA